MTVFGRGRTKTSEAKMKELESLNKTDKALYAAISILFEHEQYEAILLFHTLSSLTGLELNTNYDLAMYLIKNIENKEDKKLLTLIIYKIIEG